MKFNFGRESSANGSPPVPTGPTSKVATSGPRRWLSTVMFDFMSAPAVRQARDKGQGLADLPDAGLQSQPLKQRPIRRVFRIACRQQGVADEDRIRPRKETQRLHLIGHGRAAR
jgi:hypothetical protein